MKKIVFFMLMFCAVNVNANDITISADEKVEWHNKDNKMIAIGNAVASKEGMSISAARLEGLYEELNGKKQMSKIYAKKDVVLKSDSANATGDELEYDVKKDEAILSGNPAKIKTAEEIITAKDKIYYYPSQKQAFANGGVVAVNKEGNKIFADEMRAYFKDSNNSSMALYKVEISGKVKITTKDGEVVAEKGIYYPDSGEVKLFDNVTIFQGVNQLKGDKAEANIKTGVSKLIAGSKGRVKGSFKAKK